MNTFIHAGLNAHTYQVKILKKNVTVVWLLIGFALLIMVALTSAAEGLMPAAEFCLPATCQPSS
jgi:hypothetical protein